MDTFYDIEVEVDGRKHRGQWALRQGARLCVGGYYGSRTVDLGDRQTVNVAAQTLAELVREWKERELPAPVERSPRPEPPAQLTVLVDGRAYHGTWRLLGGIVFVYSAYGYRDAPVKRSKPGAVAERLLMELVSEWLAAPEA